MNNLAQVKHWIRATLLLALVAFGVSSCKSKKKVSEVSQPQQEVVEKDITYDDANKELEDETRDKARNEMAISSQLSRYFNAIVSAPSVTSANSSINEALSLFASPDVPVFIVIYQSSSGEVDYDEPTTAQHYLNYLKDQRKNLNNVNKMKTDASGKITELELIRK